MNWSDGRYSIAHSSFNVKLENKMNVTARSLQDKQTREPNKYYDDMGMDYRDHAPFQNYLALTKALFTPNRVLSLADIRREQGDSYNARFILDCIEKINGVVEASVCPTRWRLEDR
jgi:hypothetical protein